ncbi:MAG: DUF4340 domain-containing protein [Myxococcota bacterium]
MKQTTKTLLSLLALFAIAGGLGLYAYFGVLQGDERAEKKKAVEEKLFAVEKVDERTVDAGALQPEFVHVKVTAKGETSVLEREDGGEWRLVAPVKGKVDKLTVDQLVSQLQTAKLKHTIETTADASALKKYGLDSPRFSVTAAATVPGTNERREVTLHGGIENTFDGSIYLRKEGDPAIYSAEGGVRWALEKSSYELRDKEVLAVDEAKVKTIEVQAQRSAYVLERVDEKTWKLTQPQAMEADASTVSGMLAQLRSERALAFPSTPPAILDKPAVDATVTLDSGETVRLRLALETTDGPGKAYVLRKDSQGTTLAEVSGPATAILEKDPLELRDRSVLKFSKDAVVKMRFALSDGGELTVEKELTDGGSSETWRVVAPTQGKAKTFKLSSVLWNLGALKAARVVEEHPKSWAKYGIGPKSRSVALFDRAGKELATLTIGDKASATSETVYVRGSREVVLETDASRIQDLPAGLADVLDVPAADASR